jgi:hypothetical protein
VQARRTKLTSITEGIVDIGWAKLSLLMATFIAGVSFGVFCTVFCFMRCAQKDVPRMRACVPVRDGTPTLSSTSTGAPLKLLTLARFRNPRIAGLYLQRVKSVLAAQKQKEQQQRERQVSHSHFSTSVLKEGSFRVYAAPLIYGYVLGCMNFTHAGQGRSSQAQEQLRFGEKEKQVDGRVNDIPVAFHQRRVKLPCVLALSFWCRRRVPVRGGRRSLQTED